ncbi:MAG: hypothetical protein A2202_00075 [Bdellovibrionales bacterium RIFOXYA1_FULL_36_14]|nr:MAG: hypothetical protein A2202_00075 [Bdellovibrionales bacterium RIFOXYA1_FULL_36_14]
MIEINLQFFVKLLLAAIFVGSSFFVCAQEKAGSAQDSKENHKTPSNETAKIKEVSDTASNPYSTSEVNLHSIGLAIGQTFLHGDFSDNGENQVTFDGYYDYTASHSFDFVANTHFSKHKFRNLYTQINGLAFSIKGKFFQFDSFAPFILGGLGFYMPKQKRIIDGQIRESESKLTIGTNIGLGTELKLNRHFKLWLIIHHHNPFDIKQEVGTEIEGRYTKLLMAGFFTF